MFTCRAGQYKFYAVKLPSLADVSGFPAIVDGHYANNDNTRWVKLQGVPRVKR